MSEAQKKALIEGIKLVGRLYIASLIPIAFVVLQYVLAHINLQTYTSDIDWEFVFRMVKYSVAYESIIFIIAGLDKFKHILAKEDGRLVEGESGGIIPF